MKKAKAKKQTEDFKDEDFERDDNDILIREIGWDEFREIVNHMVGREILFVETIRKGNGDGKKGTEGNNGTKAVKDKTRP